MADCILEPTKQCDDCGECYKCDLDETKTCDNCCRCLGEADFKAIEITEIILPDQIKMKYKKKSSKKAPDQSRDQKSKPVQ